jgi:hypothetical protein
MGEKKENTDIKKCTRNYNQVFDGIDIQTEICLVRPVSAYS